MSAAGSAFSRTLCTYQNDPASQSLGAPGLSTGLEHHALSVCISRVRRRAWPQGATARCLGTDLAFGVMSYSLGTLSQTVGPGGWPESGLR